MSTSSRIFNSDSAKVDLPVFVLPNELIFAPSKRRTLLTIYNPYGNEAQFRIMTTSPDRFDVSSTEGTIKPSRRMDITIRLLSQAIPELPEQTDQPETIDYFKVSIQVGNHRGNKPIMVFWSTNRTELIDGEESRSSYVSDDKTNLATHRLKSRLHRQTGGYSNNPTDQPNNSSSSTSQRPFSGQRLGTMSTERSRSQLNHLQTTNGSNVNLVCFLCAIACVTCLYLPLALDSELCKKAKIDQSTTSETAGLLAQISNFMRVSYEMKLGCAFALGLFTYRLISTLPN